MNQKPDHTVTTGDSRSAGRSILSVVLFRSKKIIERLGAGIIGSGQKVEITIAQTSIKVITGKFALGQA